MTRDLRILRETINIIFGFPTADEQTLDQPQNHQFDLEVEVVSIFISKSVPQNFKEVRMDSSID